MRLRWIPTLLLATVFGAILGSCSSNEITFGGPLELQISSNSPVSVGDSLQLDYDVVGRSLLGLVVEWGDSELDSVFFSGAQSAGGRIGHVYGGEGSFTLMARVVDQVEGSDTEELTVTIQP